MTRGIVFVDTDHGFGLAYDPAPAGDLVIARFHGDALDRLAWEAHGRPPAFRHHFAIPEGGGPAVVTVASLVLPGADVIEGESLWPSLAQDRGFALPEWAAGTCASGGRWLGLHAAGAGPASFAVALPAPRVAGDAVSPRIAVGVGAHGEARLLADGAEVRRWSFGAPSEGGPTCLDLPPARVPAGAARIRLEITRAASAEGGIVALDAVRWAKSEID